ncbi:MAG: hypothetical protein II614_04375 [Ruminococcus sp.]|nr:hypothetical protein [Ruminococcus sp.]SCX20214.1 hypothetical protein SAMN02910436_01470 [Ruminococcaceae bacterium P7]
MKKIISVIIAGALAASLCLAFAGCGGSKGTEMPTASTTIAPTTKPSASVPTTRAANPNNNAAVYNNANNNANNNDNNNDNINNDTQESQVQDSQSSQAEQQSSQSNQNANQNPNNQSSYENSAPGGDAAIQGEQAAINAVLDYSGYDNVVDSDILVENGQEPYYKISAEDFDTGNVNTYYVYGDGTVVPAGD